MVKKLTPLRPTGKHRSKPWRLQHTLVSSQLMFGLAIAWIVGWEVTNVLHPGYFIGCLQIGPKRCLHHQIWRLTYSQVQKTGMIGNTTVLLKTTAAIPFSIVVGPFFWRIRLSYGLNGDGFRNRRSSHLFADLFKQLYSLEVWDGNCW